MKNFLCFTGIFVLLVMILLPPILRITMPKQETDEKEEVVIVKKTLSCNSESFLTRTSYENDVVKSVIIKKNIVKEIDSNEDNQDTETDSETDNDLPTQEQETPNPDTENYEKTELDILFETLKEDSRVVQQEVSDGEILTIDFTTSDYSGLNINDIVQSIDNQKNYYKERNLICSVIE